MSLTRSAPVALAILLLPASAAAADLELKRVLLSSGGVGYFEYEASVDGNAELSIAVRRDQVDDILKSIVVFDDKGSVGQISLPGNEALQDIFRELPVEEQALAGPAELLAALRGQEVRVAGSSETRGRIVTAASEPVQIGAGVFANRVRLTLMTEQGLKTLTLQDLDGVSFADARLQGRLGQALAALAQAADRERRVLSVKAAGSGKRLLRVAFVAEAPLWKAAYRLTLDPERPKSADLQGWAVLENRSGEDWKGVELTLVSGSPVTFRQALYSTYYVKRPEVPVEVVGRILPKPDQGGIALGGAAADSGKRAEFEPRPQQAAPAPPVAISRGAGSMAMAPMPGAAPREVAQIEAAESSEAQTQVRFKLPQPVSLASGFNLLVPIIARAVPAERVALYQPETQRHHPLAAVLLKNDSASSLPPGVLTLYEKGRDGADYVGDARLNAFPVGEERLLAYALDQKVKIDAEQKSAVRITRARLQGGLLEATQTESLSMVYQIAAPVDDKRPLIVERPRLGGDWSLVKPASGIEVSGNNWRVRTPISTGKFELVAERPILQRFRLDQLSTDQIAYFLQATEFTKEQKDALARLGELSREVAEGEAQVNASAGERQALGEEQARLRENLKSVPQGSDLHRRYLQQLAEQEDQFSKLAQRNAEARARVERAKAELGKYVRSLSL